MAKKGLITSLILGAVLTLSLGIYTLVSAIVAITTPVHNTVAYAYTSDQKITAFSDYSEAAGNLEIQYQEGQENCLILNTDDNSYSIDAEKEFFIQASVGTAFNVKAVATTNKHGSTTTYNLTIYKQGDGSKDRAYFVANAQGLVDLSEDISEGNAPAVFTNGTSKDGYISVVNDIDLSNVEWKGFGNFESYIFKDVFNGNGHTISNMKLHVTEENYADYLAELNDPTFGPYSTLSVGFFRNTENAEINALSLTNASVVVDEAVLSLVNPEENSTFEYVRAGLLVGDARDTLFNGAYETLIPTEDPENPEVKTNSSTISGSINTFGFALNSAINGIGGVAGVIYDSESNYQSEVSHYNVNLTVNVTQNQENVYVGAVAGEVMAYGKTVDLSNINATLNSNAMFNNRNFIGGLAGRVKNVNAENITTNTTVSDDALIRDSMFLTWYNSDARDLAKLSYIAGVVARASDSTFSNVVSNANIYVYANCSAGIAYASNCAEINNVITTGSVTGYTATGLNQYLYNSNVKFTTDAETDLVASNVDLSGWYTAALSDYARNSNIVAEGNVKVNVVINAKGMVHEGATVLQDTLHSAGLVGYFYTDVSKLTNEQIANTNEYVLSGFNVNAIINNATNAGGLVAYLGNDAQTYNGIPSYENQGIEVVIRNCTVEATITSHTSPERSAAHKVGGAVAVVYGYATLDGVNVHLAFNPNTTIGNKYGVAMFGGLVARLSGEYVTVANCEATSKAFINYTAYAKAYGDSDQYEQILAGGLIGAVASYGKQVLPGDHAIYGTNNLELPEYATYDDMTTLNTANITIQNNTVGATTQIVIDFTKPNPNDAATCMGAAGYRARSVGSLIGLLMNGIDTNADGKIDTPTQLDLSTNNVDSVTIEADQYAFSFSTQGDPVVGLSSMGYGNVNSPLQAAKCVGSSFDLVVNKNYTAITFPVPAEPAA